MPRFQLAPLFTDHAVLCRGKEIRVFGTGEEGLRLTACLLNEGGKTLCQDTVQVQNGRFCFRFPPQEAQTGCVLTVNDGVQSLVHCGIAIGDVYLASGQSNMDLELQNADEGKELYPVHRNDLVRYFNVPKYARQSPEADQAYANARWLSIAPGTAKDMSAVAYFFAMKLQPHLQAPIGIIDCYWGGTSVTCWMDEEALNATAEGQRYMREYEKLCEGKTMEAYIAEEKAFFDGQNAWNEKAAVLRAETPGISNQEIAQKIGPCPPWNPPIGAGSPFRPHGLFHTMLERVVPFTLTGVLYYQGEEDTFRTQRYDILLSSYILRLRELFEDGELPFLNVQLPMWMDAAAVEDSKLWPRLRLAQQKVYRNTRNTGLAVLLDQGEYDNIHPTNKRVVGERLYEAALDAVYHEPARLSPFACGKYQQEGKLHVCLSASVQEREEGEYLLEIAGEDGVFLPAQVSLKEKELVLSHPDISRPVMARYAWTDYAIVRLFGENGLPLAPFWIQ